MAPPELVRTLARRLALLAVASLLPLVLLSAGSALAEESTRESRPAGVAETLEEPPPPCPAPLQPPERTLRRRETPPAHVDEEWRRKVCEIVLAPVTSEAKGVDAGGDLTIGYRLLTAPQLHFPALADSNSPLLRSDNELVVFNSYMRPWRSAGAGLEEMSEPVEVTCGPCTRGGGRWLESVWKDDVTGILYGWYHYEPDDLPCYTAPIIGATLSFDGGRTWNDQGVVLDTRHGIDCTYDNGFFVGGHGDFTVIPDAEQRYFYFVFTTYGGPAEQQGVGIARGEFAERGQPGTVVKYYRGAWSEPGVGGESTAIFASPTSWKGPYVDSFWGPSVHWNPYIGRYVALLNRTAGLYWEQEGVYITFSEDLTAWTTPRKLLDANAWYPQVAGIGPDATDKVAGRLSRLYVGGISDFVLEFER